MRILNHAFRIYIDPSQLGNTVTFYEELQGKPCDRRLSFPQLGIAVVGAFSALGGTISAKINELGTHISTGK